MVNFKAIGNRIKQLRKSVNMTQETLAEKLNISSEHMSRIETGACRASVALIEKAAVIFGTSEEYIMFGIKADNIYDKQLCEKINLLSDEKRETVINLIDMLL